MFVLGKNGPLEKQTFGQEGHFLDYCDFGIIDRRKNGQTPLFCVKCLSMLAN